MTSFNVVSPLNSLDDVDLDMYHPHPELNPSVRLLSHPHTNSILQFNTTSSHQDHQQHEQPHHQHQTTNQQHQHQPLVVNSVNQAPDFLLPASYNRNLTTGNRHVENDDNILSTKNTYNSNSNNNNTNEDNSNSKHENITRNGNSNIKSSQPDEELSSPLTVFIVKNKPQETQAAPPFSFITDPLQAIGEYPNSTQKPSTHDHGEPQQQLMQLPGNTARNDIIPKLDMTTPQVPGNAVTTSPTTVGTAMYSTAVINSPISCIHKKPSVSGRSSDSSLDGSLRPSNAKITKPGPRNQGRRPGKPRPRPLRVKPPEDMNMKEVRKNAETARDVDMCRLEQDVGSPDANDIENTFKRVRDRAFKMTETEKVSLRQRRRKQSPTNATDGRIDAKSASRLEALLSRYSKDCLIQCLLEEIRVMSRDKCVMKRALSKWYPLLEHTVQQHEKN